jgi:hypothetical protein
LQVVGSDAAGGGRGVSIEACSFAPLP